MQLNLNDDQVVASPDAKIVRSSIVTLPVDQFIVLSLDDDHYIQVFHNDDGTYQLEYRDGSAEHHFGTDPDYTSTNDVLRAFDAYLQQIDDWQALWKWENIDLDDEDSEALRVPDKFLIGHDEYHAKHIGRTADGNQFFLTTPFIPVRDESPGCEFIALFVFDPNGKLIEAKIDRLGPRAAVDKDEARRLYNERLKSLSNVEFCVIEIAPFKVTRFDTEFGLIPREPEDAEDELLIELHPGNYMAFYHPWDGKYDT